MKNKSKDIFFLRRRKKKERRRKKLIRATLPVYRKQAPCHHENLGVPLLMLP
jgi:hypothetical protein